MEDIEARLRSYVLENFLPGERASNLADDTPLRTSGIVDSLGLLQLVSFVEESFGIELEAHETGVEHFDRIADLAALVRRKLGA